MIKLKSNSAFCLVVLTWLFLGWWDGLVFGQPQSGDVFREYIWLPTMVQEREQFLRVGGKLDYQIAEEHMDPNHHQNGFLTIADSFDLRDAIKAEVMLEMVQSHDDTKGLAIMLNDGDWHTVPPLPHVPQPQSAYMLHAFPHLEIPLQDLMQGYGNAFKLKVDTAQRWQWPQHIFYALVFRVYYDSEKKLDVDFQIEVSEGEKEHFLQFVLPCKASNGIARVDYLGKFLDYNLEGDGQYLRWHGHTHRGQLRNHIGGSDVYPFKVDWNTEWLADQPGEMQVMARIFRNDGLLQMSPIQGFSAPVRTFSVQLCRPYHQPKNWATREDTLQAYFSLHGDVEEIEAYQLAWRSWSPCYGAGVFINGQQVWDREGPCYDYAEHLIEVADGDHLLVGENEIKTGMTPLHNGKMVHGMEVQFPGIMIKVRYRRPQQCAGICIEEGAYQGRPHYIIRSPKITYYYDRAGGGFSRMIDHEENDWIDFKMEPWGDYPAAAASAFRGVPNFVHGSNDAGAGHPGHDQCTSTLVDDHTIFTTSESGKWKWQWSFHDTYASVDVLAIDPDHAYWFLYEGVPGGKYEPSKQFYGHNLQPEPQRQLWDFYRGDKLFDHFQWMYFGHENVDRVLFVKQAVPDNNLDTFSFLGNSEQGISSEDGMVVFGFGRADGAKPLLRQRHTFHIGFYEQSGKLQDHLPALQKYLQDLE